MFCSWFGHRSPLLAGAVRTIARMFRPGLEPLEDRTLPSNIVWTNRLTASDKFTARERAVVDHAIVLWERIIEDFHTPGNEFQLRFTGGSRSGLNLGGTVAGLASVAFGASAPSGWVRIDANAGGTGWYIDRVPSNRTEFKKTITPTHFAGGSGGSDLLSVVLHEIGHCLGLPHFKAPNDLMNPVGTTGHRYLPTLRDVAYIADHSPFTVKYAGITPRVSFSPDTIAWANDSEPAPVVTVILSAVPTTTVTVGYAVAGGTAILGDDYNLPSGTLTFAPGEYRKSLPLTILPNADPNDQFVETIDITLQTPTGALPGFYYRLTFQIFDTV